MKAAEIVKAIQDGNLDPTTLTKDERLPVIELLKYSFGWSIPRMTEFFNLSRTTLKDDVTTIRLIYGKATLEKDIENIVGELVGWAESLTYKAIKKDDLALAWKIQLDLIEKLQDFGVVYKKPLEVKGELTVQSLMEKAFKYEINYTTGAGVNEPTTIT
jgi:hypothetical protein